MPAPASPGPPRRRAALGGVAPAGRRPAAGRAGRRDDRGRDRGARPDARGRARGARDRRVGPRAVLGRRRVRLRGAGRGDVLAGGVRRPAASRRRGRRAAAAAVAVGASGRRRDGCGPTWCTRTGCGQARSPSSRWPAGDAGHGAGGDRGSWSPCTTRRRSAGERGRLVYRLLERVVARGADLVLCVSPDLEARMRVGRRAPGRPRDRAAGRPGLPDAVPAPSSRQSR